MVMKAFGMAIDGRGRRLGEVRVPTPPPHQMVPAPEHRPTPGPQEGVRAYPPAQKPL
ncbi:MAG: hypothetical protein H6853_07545 [Rhodospirillales bacterium]|nr:hypothetical protein [Alphaproteobacteria bacterium]USO03375.1 MAG: hypothetical protein H6853_07545 [Rhodospirillales bacterium]